MPYTHWANLNTQNEQLRERFQNTVKGRQFDTHPRRSLDEAAHRYHSYASLKDRNDDQVVTKYLKREKERIEQHKKKVKGVKPQEKPAHTTISASKELKAGHQKHELTLMVVDQLWLWILDQGSYFPTA